jgi:large repetitive protein
LHFGGYIVISTPFNLFTPSVSWTQIPTTVLFSISAQNAQAGPGVIGPALLSGTAALIGPAGSGTGSGSPNAVAQSLNAGTVGTAYSETIAAVNGVSPYTFAVSSGSLPAGCSLNTSTGVISGTPTTAATYTFSIQVTDSSAAVGPAQNFQIVIAAAAVSGSGAFGWVS